MKLYCLSCLSKIPQIRKLIVINSKLRNRLSQKAFRARQSVYIKELERRLEDASKPETERNADLEERNKFYSDQLLESHKKLESLQVSLQAVLDSVADALGLQVGCSPLY
jgi:hypothetical protein